MNFTPANYLRITKEYKGHVPGRLRELKVVPNKNGLDIRIWGYCEGDPAKGHGFTEPTYSFIVVKKELKRHVIGRWGDCSVAEYEAGALENLTQDQINATIRNYLSTLH